MLHRIRFLALAGGCVCLTSLAVAGCGSAPSPKSAPPASPAASASARPAASAGFAGYDWQVVAISHGGKVTTIPAPVRTLVYLRFSRAGRFGANDGVNFHDGTYHLISGGFATSALGVTATGYGGHDPVVLLAESAIAAFDNGARATVKLTGDRLVVGVASYTLTCQRHGPAGNNV